MPFYNNCIRKCLLKLSYWHKRIKSIWRRLAWISCFSINYLFDISNNYSTHMYSRNDSGIRCKTTNAHLKFITGFSASQLLCLTQQLYKDLSITRLYAWITIFLWKPNVYHRTYPNENVHIAAMLFDACIHFFLMCGTVRRIS